ncbi:MAG: hypothetical protein HQ580_05900 [Planctomycetes bacterium]|nr:hypothetical protein [Planctomycetota bacterium]
MNDKLYSISTRGQHEVPYRHIDMSRSPVRDVVHKNSAEPQVEMRLAYQGNHVGLPLLVDIAGLFT